MRSKTASASSSVAARLAPPLQPPLRRPEREQRARAVERKLHLGVPPERLLVRRLIAPSTVLAWAASKPRQRATATPSAGVRSSRRAFPSYQSSSSTASSRRPSSIERLDLVDARTARPRARRSPRAGRMLDESVELERRRQSGSPERELQVAERCTVAKIQAGPPPVSGASSSARPSGRPGRSTSPAMRLDEALEREVVREERVLARLLGNALAPSRASECAPRARRARTRPGRAGRRATGASSRPRARARPPHRARRRRAPSRSPSQQRVLGGQRTAAGAERGLSRRASEARARGSAAAPASRAPEQRRGRPPRAERLGGERVAPLRARSVRGRPGVSTASSSRSRRRKSSRRDPLVRDGERLAIALGLVHRLAGRDRRPPRTSCRTPGRARDATSSAARCRPGRRAFTGVAELRPRPAGESPALVVQRTRLRTARRRRPRRPIPRA